MLNSLPINSEAVNGPGVLGTVRLMSATGLVRASVVTAGSRRTRLLRATAVARVTAIKALYKAFRSMAGLALVAATINPKPAMQRRKALSATALVRVSGTMSFLGLLRRMSGSALVRASASMHMEVNQAYFVISAVARAAFNATLRMQVIKQARFSYTVARVTARLQYMTAYRKIASTAVLRVTAPLATFRRERVMGSTVTAGAIGHLQFTAARKFASLAKVITTAITSGLVKMRFIKGTARIAVTTQGDMVTWLYVKESDDRTVFVRSDYSTTRAQSFKKQPREVLPYDIDLAEWLEPLIGDDVESAQVDVTGAVNGLANDLIIDKVVLIAKDVTGQQDIQASRVKVWLRGGIHGATYKITALLETEGGRVKEVDFKLKVREV